MMEKEKKPEVESDLVNAWRVFDADDKGFIESRDLRRIINSMDDSIPKAEIQQLLLDADLTKDRRLTFEGRFYSYLLRNNHNLINLQNVYCQEFCFPEFKHALILCVGI